MKYLRFLLMAALIGSMTGCNTRSAFQRKSPPDPLVSSAKKPIVGLPTSGNPICRTQVYPGPPPIPEMSVRHDP